MYFIYLFILFIYTEEELHDIEEQAMQNYTKKNNIFKYNVKSVQQQYKNNIGKL